MSRSHIHIQTAASTWHTERTTSPDTITTPIPLPQSLYSSPFTRALSTAKITFGGFPFIYSATSAPSASSALDEEKVGAERVKGERGIPPILIVEDIREVNGEHTCDMRSAAHVIKKRYNVLDPLDPSSSSNTTNSTIPESSKGNENALAFELETPFADADPSWTPEREADEHVRVRAHAALERIFEFDEARCESLLCLGLVVL